MVCLEEAAAALLREAPMGDDADVVDFQDFGGSSPKKFSQVEVRFWDTKRFNI